jgi:hypothetical protein
MYYLNIQIFISISVIVVLIFIKVVYLIFKMEFDLLNEIIFESVNSLFDFEN